MASIQMVKCVSRDGIVEGWTVQFSNGSKETYTGEIPPQNVSRFCRAARYGYKVMCGSYLGEMMIDIYSKKPLANVESEV